MVTVGSKSGRKYFSKERKLLKFAGLSFNSNESKSYKIYSYLLLFCFNFMYPLLEFFELFKQDAEVISDMLIYLFAVYLGLAKTIVVLQNRSQVGGMMDRLEKEPFTINIERGGTEEEKLNKDCIWITNIQTNTYVVACYLTMYSSLTYTLIKRLNSSNPEDWELPFGPLTILNITYSPNFEITWLYQNVSINFIVAHFAAVDLLMAAMLAHLSYQFRMLQNTFRRLVKNCFNDAQKEKRAFKCSYQEMNPNYNAELSGSTISWKYLHEHLINAIEYHMEIINLAKDMEHVFSKLLLIIFLETLGLLCFSVYRLSVVHDNMKLFIHMLEVISGCLQVLCVCYWGEQVLHESREVGRAAYETGFIGTDLRFQKGLVLIIRRSQNPTKLTAGKFANICLSTFTWIIRTSYSAFMVVKGTSSDKSGRIQ